jgi:hypothetical protein
MLDLLFGYHVLVLEGSLDSKVYCWEGSQSSHPIIIIIIVSNGNWAGTNLPLLVSFM